MAATARASELQDNDTGIAIARGFGPMVASLSEYRRAAAAERRDDGPTGPGASQPANASRRAFAESCGS